MTTITHLNRTIKTPSCSHETGNSHRAAGAPDGVDGHHLKLWGLRLVGTLLAMLLAVPASAIDYRARKSGEWDDPSRWSPRGVPGSGDRVVSLGRHSLTVAGEVRLGGPTPDQTALVLDGAGTLTLNAGATLILGGHALLSGEGAALVLQASAQLLFDPGNGVAQLQMFNRGQRITFNGQAAARATIGLAPGAQGHWFVASQGHRDSLLAGAYGRIRDALDPESGKAWSMYLANDVRSSKLVARKIEFVNCGQVGVFGLDAGEFTTVDLSGWTFTQSHPDASGVPALWFDGYGDVVVMARPSKSRKRIRDLASDKEIYVRFVQGFEFENWVLGASGVPGSVRAGNNGGNAALQRDLFQVVRDSGGVGLLADVTENVYMYAEADNPHGFETRHLRGDALLRNFWFESHYPNQSDTGDAILTNGPQSWVAEHGGAPVTLTVEHSGSIGDTSKKPHHPVFLTVNNGEGMRFRLRNNVMRQPARFNAIALDENGATPAGTGLEFVRNLVFASVPTQGYAIGSASSPQVVNPDAFTGIDDNLYYNLQPRPGGYPAGVHALKNSSLIDARSRGLDPMLRDPSRNLAQWDLLLGGPGTAEHAIEQLRRMNDDDGFDPAYRVSGLIAFVRGGFVPGNPELIDEQGMPVVGPALQKVPTR